MWRRIFFAVSCASAAASACGSFGSDAPAARDGADAAVVGSDAAGGNGDGSSATDASAPGRCNTEKPFTEVAPVLGPDKKPIGAPASAFSPTLTADESTLIFMMAAPDAGSMLVRATRAGADFGAPEPIPSIPTKGRDTYPTLSMDGTLLVFASDRKAPGTLAPLLLHAAPRFADGGFGEPFLLEELAAGASSDSTPFLSADAKELHFSRIGTSPDIHRATRRPDGGFGDPKPVDAVNTLGEEYSPVLSADGLTLYFSSDRNYTKLSTIFVARRKAPSDPFQLPVVVAELDNGLVRNPAWLSPDNCRLYFQSVVGDGRYGIYVASRHP